MCKYLTIKALDMGVKTAAQRRRYREYFRKWKANSDAKLKAEETYYIPNPRSSATINKIRTIVRIPNRGDNSR
jgi:hypothetical protein